MSDKKQTGFDLANFNLDKKAEDGAIYVPHHPANRNEKLPMKLFLVGHDSKTYKNAVKRMNETTRNLKPEDEEARDEAACVLLADCTKGWEGVVKNGEEIKFTREAAKELYAENSWLFEQVNLAITDRSRFF